MEISVKELCEKTAPCGSIDLRRTALRVVESKRLRALLVNKAGYVYAKDVSISRRLELDGIDIILQGHIDVVVQSKDGYILNEIKCINTAPLALGGEAVPTHLSEAICLAYMYAKENRLTAITIRLTYGDVTSEEVLSFDYLYDVCDLEVYCENLVSMYALNEIKKLERNKRFMKSAKRTAFPYEEYRDGQRIFAEHALEAICTGKRLFAEAPTGIGKTMSALFPAIKAAGNAYGKKIFYFTSKTTIAEAAREAFKLMLEKGLDATCIVVSAKERTCKMCPDCCDPTSCMRADGHYDRINEAVNDAVSNERVFDAEVVEKYAAKHNVCAYELSLGISEWCELVICDYNYLFDPIVYFRRYFDGAGDYIFLIDEAHNLGERARAMYSHAIKSSDIELLLATLNPNDNILFPKLYEIYEYMKSANKLVEVKKRGSGEMGFFKSEKPFGILNRKLNELVSAFDKYFKHRPDAPKQLNDIYFEIKKYLKISEYYNEKYVSLIEYRNASYIFRQVCIDPSEIINRRLYLGRSAIIFSATLTPLDYYKSILSARENDLTLTLDSPFPKENLCIATTYKFSTRLDDRNVTVKALVNLLYTMISAKDGNYIAFFPSYKYMSTVHEEFVKAYPYVKTIMQHSEMSESERREYLEKFEKKDAAQEVPAEQETSKKDMASLLALTGLKRGSDFFGASTKVGEKKPEIKKEEREKCASMLAFGVLGGVFAEGVDFAGDKLIGTAIVGVGLPGINDDSNLVCEYYNNHSDDDYARGYEYAYRIPGMVKVLQAAGRVIRSEADRGVILLIDDRYATREYMALYPNHWKEMKLIGDKKALAELLRRFWEE